MNIYHLPLSPKILDNEHKINLSRIGYKWASNWAFNLQFWQITCFFFIILRLYTNSTKNRLVCQELFIDIQLFRWISNDKRNTYSMFLILTDMVAWFTHHGAILCKHMRNFFASLVLCLIVFLSKLTMSSPYLFTYNLESNKIHLKFSKLWQQINQKQRRKKKICG